MRGDPVALLPPALAAAAGWQLANDTLGAAAGALLWLIWRVLRTPGLPPVIPLALTFQWLQVTSGLFFSHLTGRMMATMWLSEYRTMVWIGLGCVFALTLGLWAGIEVVARHWQMPARRRLDIPWATLMLVYVAMTATEGTLHRLAWEVPLVTQAILTLTLTRLGVLYLMLRRFAMPRIQWAPLLGLVGVEVVLGATGYFAGFREPLFLALAVLLQRFEWRRIEHHAAIALIAVVALSVSVVWMAVRDPYRAEFRETETFATTPSVRLETLVDLASRWLETDTRPILDDVEALVDRVWAVYYPALAVARVPSALPHTDGEILTSALTHIVTPRFLFPDKPTLPSDSEMVRKYSGLYVAGSEQDTSIAFGYAAESYVDFGLPWMFAPVLVYGFIVGIAYAVLLRAIHHEELGTVLVTVVFWLSLYLFERSWIKILGNTTSMVVYLGALAWAIDRYLVAYRVSGSVLAPLGRKDAIGPGRPG